MVEERLEELSGFYSSVFGKIIYLEEGFCKRADEERPDGAVVVGGVPLMQGTGVTTDKAWVIGRKGSEAEGCEQVILDDMDDSFLSLEAKRRVRQGDGEYLVGAEALVGGAVR